MQRETTAVVSATPAQIMQQYVQCLNDGDVKKTLTEDCILKLFMRNVEGGDPVASYLRAQLSGRYEHTGFELPSYCAAAEQESLTTRYSRRFERIARRLKREAAVSTATLTLDSDDEDQQQQQQQMTPPRSVSEVAALQYIEAKGVLKTRHAVDDGGIDFGLSRPVRLLLGFSRISSPQVCLIIYENQTQRSTQRRLPIGSQRNVFTDDEESEAPDVLNVRRTLFSLGDGETKEKNNDVVAERRLASRKRQHERGGEKEKTTKYPNTVFNSMRL